MQWDRAYGEGIEGECSGIEHEVRENKVPIMRFCLPGGGWSSAEHQTHH